MYEVNVKTGFSAAHQLRLYDGKYENLHGHNWSAQVTVEADELDTMGVGIDFVKLKQMVEEILGELDYQNINEIPPFDELNPSAENIAILIYNKLIPHFDKNYELKITLYETPRNFVEYSG